MLSQIRYARLIQFKECLVFSFSCFQNKSDDIQESSRSKHLDFLDILISARDDEGVGLTDLEIRNEVDTFLFAGHDTTASSLTWMMYALAKSPQHQQRAQKEVDEIFHEKGSCVLEWYACR